MRGALLSLLALVGCSSSASNADLGPLDGRQGDRAVTRIDSGAEGGAVDGPRDAPADLEPDLPRVRDGGGDIPTSDATVSPVTVLYVAGNDSDQFGLRTLQTQTAAGPVAVTGFGGLIDFEPLAPAELVEALPLGAARPRVSSEGAFGGVRLPGALGTLFSFHRKLLGTSGLLLVRSDGTFEVLLEVFGLYSDTIGGHVALGADGTLGAALEAGKTVQLFRTDGATLANGKVAQALAAPAQIDGVVPTSLALAGGFVYCVGLDAQGKRSLLRAPGDGSAGLTTVSLPDSAGKVPAFIDDALVSSADGGRLLLTAGASAVATDVYVVDGQTGSAKRLTDDPAEHAPRGETFGTTVAKRALSPAGTRAAFVRRMAGADELFVVPTDGVGPIAHVTDTRFQPQAANVANLLFVGESELVFMVGVTDLQFALYRYDGTDVTNLAGIGGTVPPFDGQGDFRPEGAWIVGDRLYYIATSVLFGFRELRALDLLSFATSTVHTAGRVGVDPRTMALCPSTGVLYFVSEKDPNKRQREIWRFDQNVGTPATRLVDASAAGPGPWTVTALTLAGDCSRLLWTAGGNDELRTLWQLELTTPGAVPQRMTAVPRSFVETLGLTPDGASVVYASGSTFNKNALRGLPLAGGPPVVLDSVGGYVYLLAVY